MENKFKLPYRIDTEALALSMYYVLDFNYKSVREFETYADAVAFVAEANGTDIETVRRNAVEQDYMLQQYRQNLRRSMAQKAKEMSSDSGAGWSWDTLPEEIKARFPPPPSREAFSSNQEYEQAGNSWKSRVGRNIGMVLQQYKQKRQP